MAKILNDVTFNNLSRIGKGSKASNLAFPGITSEADLQDYIDADEEYRNIQSLLIDWNGADWSSIPDNPGEPSEINTTADLLKAIKYASEVGGTTEVGAQGLSHKFN